MGYYSTITNSQGYSMPEFNSTNQLPTIHGLQMGVNKPFFEMYRRQILSRHVGERYELDGLPTEHTPRYWAAQSGRTPSISLDLLRKDTSSMLVSPAGLVRVHDFYTACQQHRRYYNDSTGKVHPLDFFQPREYRWSSPGELTERYIKHPSTYVKYKQPLTLPLYMGRTWTPAELDHRRLAGKRSPYPDLCFPR